jgi:SAM-dependent methyltransferase
MSSNFWDEKHGGSDYAYGREPNDFLREMAPRIPKGRVLCLAEGGGRNAVYLAGLGHEVTAMDFSAEGLTKADSLARERNVPLTTTLADLATYELPRDTFTGIVAIFAHLPPDLRARVLGDVTRALVPGGVFVLEAYRPAQLALGTGGPKDVTLLMTLEALRKELAPLTLDIGREVERDIREGTLHHGKSATVQVLAVRTGG